MTETENWLAGIAQKQAGQRSAVLMQDQRDPEKVAESLTLGAELDLPPNVVEASPDVFRSEAARRRSTTALTGAPATQRWLEDPTNAGLAKDDIENLSSFERFIANPMGGYVRAGEIAADTQLGRGVQTGAKGAQAMGQGLWALPAQARITESLGALENYETLRDMDPTMARHEMAEALGIGADSREATFAYAFLVGDQRTRGMLLERATGRLLRNREAMASVQTAIQQYQTEMQETQGRVANFTDIDDAKDFADWFAFNTGQALPYLAVTAFAGALGGPGGVAAAGYGMGVGDINAELIGEGVTDRADLALAGGTAYAALEFMGPAAAPFRNVSRAALTETARGYFRSLGREIPQQAIEEFINEAGQEIIKAYTVAEGTGEAVQLTDAQLLEWFNAGMAGAASGAAMAPLTAAARPGTEREIEAAAAAGTTAERLAQIDEMAAQSQLRGRSVERFEAALKAQGGEAQDYFLPAEDLREYFQAKDMAFDDETLEAWGVDPSAWEEALAVGGDVSVSEATYAARISGTEDAEWFAQNARRDPDEMSLSEAARFNSEVGEILGEEARQQAEEEIAALEERADDVQIRESFVRDLRAAGRSPDVAAQEAEVFTAFLRTMASRTGQSPLALSRQMPVRIQGPFADEARRRGDIDLRLNALRRNPERALAAQGMSLMEYVRSQGGISDRGGDVADLEPGPGIVAETFQDVQDRLSQPTMGGMPRQGRGLGLDDMGSMARDAGYFGGREGAPEDLLLEALRQEMAGNPEYLPGEGPDPGNVELSEELARRGIDMAMSNDEIVAALEAGEGAREFGQERRGSIQIPRGGLRDGETVINLFEGADLSTLLHESGHYFLEAFDALAADDANPQLAEDMASIREWLGVGEGEPFTTEQHEKWARGFEAYVMEGKAPSLALADAFARFKAWLTRIYRSALGLNVKITPEIREVMDRMLATDEEIAAARDVAAMDPLFKDGPPPGMSETDYRTYARMARRGEETAQQALLERTMAKVRREREAWYKAEKAAVREEVENGINRQPVYRATELMANQRWIGNDDADLPDMRIDRHALIDQFGEGVIPEVSRQALGGKRAIYSDDGVSPGEAAEFFGFESAAQMVEALQNAGKRKEAISVEVERRMQERHGDPLNDGTIEEEALRVIHNDQQSKAGVREVRYLAERLGRSTRNMNARIYRQRARQMLGRMQVAQVVKPRQFLQAERKAARAAQDAFAKAARNGGREAMATALQAKEQQILNGYLYNEAREMERMIERKREHMRELGTRKVREKIGQRYVEQIDAILDHYDFRRRTGRQIQRSQNLRAFMEQMREEGRESDLNIDPRLIDAAERRHYSRLTMDELQGVFDTVENIEHLGRFKEKLIEKNRRRDAQESADRIIDQVRANAKAGDPAKKRRGRQYLNLFRSPDTIMAGLDGGEEFGPVYEELKRAIDDGAALEQQMAAENGARLDAAFSDHYTRAEVKALMQPMNLDGLSLRRDWTKAEVLALALNAGNADNFQRITDPNVTAERRLTRDEVQDLVSRLDERDWRFVQRMWDEVNRLWPDLAAVHRRRSGVEPAKVEGAMMVDAPDFVTGGYYPLKYDPSVSVKADRDERSAFDDAQSLGWGASAAVGSGMTKERAQNAQGRPVLLDLSVAHRHIRETSRYIALSEAVDNSWRLLNREDVGEAMKAHGHDDTRETLRLWLQDTAMGPVFNQDIVNATARALKNNFTMSKLAFNMKTVALQVTGLGQSAAVVGKRNMAKALVTYGKAPRELSAEVVAKSPFMAERETTFQKDVFDMLNEGDVSTPLKGDYQKVRDWTMRAGMWGIQKTQFYTVDMPTWLAGYREAIEGGQDEATAISRADRLVARSQSSGLLSDRSGIERGTVSAKTRQSDFMKLFTTLGSYMIAKNNRAQITLMQARKGVKESETAVQAVAPVLNAAVDLSLLFAFEAIVMGFGYAWLAEDEDEDALAKYIMAETALAPVVGMPFARDVASGFRGFGTGGAYGSIGETVVRPVIQAQQGEVDRSAMRAFADAFGLATGFPSTVAFRVGDGVIGEATPAEVLFGSNPLDR